MILREETDDDFESDSRVLGFVPVTRSNVDELDRCLVVSTTGISFVAPKLWVFGGIRGFFEIISYNK